MGEYQDFVFAARTINKANALMGNREECAWTADQLYDLASSVAAEAGTAGRCPICSREVYANSSARVQKHRAGNGDMCTASGQWFHIAVSEINE